MSLRIPNNFLRRVSSRLFPSGKYESERKWLVVSVIAFILLLLCHHHAHAQIVTSNPGEYTILATGNGIINKTVKSETNEHHIKNQMKKAKTDHITHARY